MTPESSAPPRPTQRPADRTGQLGSAIRQTPKGYPMFLRTHTYVQPDDAISIRQNTAESDRAAIEIRDGYHYDTSIDMTKDRLRELRDLIGSYLTGDPALRSSPNPAPTADTPPAPMSDEQAADTIEAMTPDELRSALKWLAGARPVEFASAVREVNVRRAEVTS